MCYLAAPQGEQTFYSEILSKSLKVSFILFVVLYSDDDDHGRVHAVVHFVLSRD